MDSSKHSWSGILVQYTEQTREDGTKFKVPHPITYQSGNIKGSQKNLSTSTKEVYIMIRCDHALLQKFVYSLTKTIKVDNWSQEIHSITPHIEFEHIKGKENVLADSLL